MHFKACKFLTGFIELVAMQILAILNCSNISALIPSYCFLFTLVLVVYIVTFNKEFMFSVQKGYICEAALYLTSGRIDIYSLKTLLEGTLTGYSAAQFYPF